MTTSIRNQFLMMLAIISLIACGFQLRGSIEANFDSISINLFRRNITDISKSRVLLG